MKKLILVIFICLNVFGTDKIEIDKNIVNLEVDEQNFTFDIKDEDIIVNINEVNECLRNLCYINMEWVEEHDFAFDELDIDAETKELSIYRFFNNIMENLTEDDILNAQINLESKKRKK